MLLSSKKSLFLTYLPVSSTRFDMFRRTLLPAAAGIQELNIKIEKKNDKRADNHSRQIERKSINKMACPTRDKRLVPFIKQCVNHRQTRSAHVTEQAGHHRRHQKINKNKRQSRKFNNMAELTYHKFKKLIRIPRRHKLPVINKGNMRKGLRCPLKMRL